MSAGNQITESDLHAFVDSELDDARRIRVESWLAENPTDRFKVDVWRQQKRDIHSRFDSVLDELIPVGIEAALAGGRRMPFESRFIRAVAAVLVFAAGAVLGWGGRDFYAGREQPMQQLVSQAVGAHVMYVAEVRHPVEVPANEETHLLTWLSRRLGYTLRAPRLAEHGFELVGGRLLPDSGGPAAQFMYEDKGGRRVTLYVRTGLHGPDTAFRFATERDVAAFYWVDGPLGYALIGRVPREQLLTLSRLVYEDYENAEPKK
ncbi:MAG: anti-sigma factor [Rhodospirillales bacterium]|nr:anti-sigma factor [Rhodospirillales bacterium]